MRKVVSGKGYPFPSYISFLANAMIASADSAGLVCSRQCGASSGTSSKDTKRDLNHGRPGRDHPVLGRLKIKTGYGEGVGGEGVSRRNKPCPLSQAGWSHLQQGFAQHLLQYLIGMGVKEENIEETRRQYLHQ